MRTSSFALVACLVISGVGPAFGEQILNSFSNPPLPQRSEAYAPAGVTSFASHAQRSLEGGAGCNGCATGCCTSGCASGCCDCACSDCNHCCASKCCYGCCLHRTGAFAEWLYITPRNIDMAYGVPQDGIGAIGTTPQGGVAVADLEYDSGFRAGVNLAVDCMSSITLTFAWFETDDTDAITVAAPNVVQPLTMFPGTFNAGFTGQQALAAYDLEYQLVDLDYRAVLWSCKGAHVNYVLGARYGHLESAFAATYLFAPPDGTTQVATDIDFDGAGIKFGLEGERRIFRRSGLSVYGKGSVSALAGQFSASYVQLNQFNGLEALTSWQDDRVITISELELGLGWTNRRGNLRVSGGYYFAIWDNVVTTPEWVDAVQNVNFTDVSQDDDDTIAFDGAVVRVELLY